MYRAADLDFNQYGPTSLISALRVCATRTGVTCESIGQWHNLAARFERLGNKAEVVKCCEEALRVDRVFGQHDSAFAMGERTREVILARIAAAQA